MPKPEIESRKVGELFTWQCSEPTCRKLGDDEFFLTSVLALERGKEWQDDCGTCLRLLLEEAMQPLFDEVREAMENAKKESAN